jgi:hypothetical protein
MISSRNMKALTLVLGIAILQSGCDGSSSGITDPGDLRMGEASLVMTGDLSMSTKANAMGSVVLSQVPDLSTFSGTITSSSSTAMMVVIFGGAAPDVTGRRTPIPVMSGGSSSPEIEGKDLAWLQVTVQRMGSGMTIVGEYYDAGPDGWLEVVEYGMDPSGVRFMLLEGDLQLDGFDFDPLGPEDVSPNGKSARLRMSARVPLDCMGAC